MRCQTILSIWTLKNHKPVIPSVPFIRWAITFPFNIIGSLWPTLVTVWFVNLTVKQTLTITLYYLPLCISVTFWEIATPAKLTIIYFLSKLDKRNYSEWYFTVASAVNLRLGFKSSHLFYTDNFFNQYKILVKVHRVFPSSRYYFASSQKIQFHWNTFRDSKAVVTPLMHVGTSISSSSDFSHV